MAFYYPEGIFGPVCDVIRPEADIARDGRGALAEPDEREITLELDGGDDDYGPTNPVVIKRIRCKKRSDGTYYDCIYEWLNDTIFDDWERCIAPQAECYDWGDRSVRELRLEEDFFIPDIGPDACFPFDPDINIRNNAFFSANGERVLMAARERSSPVTFPVSSRARFLISNNSVQASFAGTLSYLITDPSINLRVNGTSTRNWGNGSGAFGGFVFPNGGGDKYLAFGNPGTTPFSNAQVNRLATVTLNMDGFDTLVLEAIAGNENNGGERPNIAGEGLYVVWPNGSEAKLIPARDELDGDRNSQSDSYDSKYGGWRNITTNIPSQYRKDNVDVILKQTLIDSAIESGIPTNIHPNGFDAFGVSKIGVQGTALQTSGSGTANLRFNFEWDDNPDDWDTALGQVIIGDVGGSIVFSRDTDDEDGEENKTLFGVSSGLYRASIRGNKGGFEVENNNQRLCFKDGDGDDCNAKLRITNTTGGITAKFTRDGDLRITGSGVGNVEFNFEYDDNPDNAGLAIESISFSNSEGLIFIQTPGQEKGSQQESLEVTAGATFPVTIQDNSGGYEVVNNGKKIKFFDRDGKDTNASLEVTVEAQNTIENDSYWSDRGNALAAWVNPEVCTLPQRVQTVTYRVNIAQADEYNFEFACDDVAQLFFEEETVPALDIEGGIFRGGALSTPYNHQRNLSAGIIEFTVRCTNSAAGYIDGDGDPFGGAYEWTLNPGGWYIRICRGGQCIGGDNTAPWVPSFPWHTWNNFMNTYAVWPSATDPNPGVYQSASWTFNVPSTGNYVLRTNADNTATFVVDGVTIGTTTGFQGPVIEYPLNNFSSGPHTLTVSALNVTNSNGTNINWEQNPAGVAWTIEGINGNVDATFNNQGGLVVTGDGTGVIQFEFEWDDNPGDAGQALGTFSIPGIGLSFTQTSGVEEGSDSASVTAKAGTYNANINNNTGGFDVTNGGKRINFRDNDGDDNNAILRIVGSSQQNVIIASSLDTSSGNGNIIWTTRDATGYEYYEVT